METYSELVRPKHHYRLHLPAMYRQHGYVDCWAQESKHRDYKNVASSVQSRFLPRSGQTSGSVLPRLLMRNVTQLVEAPWINGLHEPCFPPEDVQAMTGLKDCRISRGFHLGSLAIFTNDVLCIGKSVGVVLFVVERNSSPMVVLERLLPCSNPDAVAVRYRFSGTKVALNLLTTERVWMPMWWHQEDDELLCVR